MKITSGQYQYTMCLCIS